MTHSRKNKSRRKVRKSRTQRGGQNNLTWELDRSDRVFQDGKKYRDHSVFWTDEPIIIPEKEGAEYIGEYWIDYNDFPIMQGRGRLVYDEENPKTGMRTIYDGYWHENKKSGGINFEYMNGDNGYAEFVNDGLVKPGSWRSAPTYNYADGKVYKGELVIKNGKAVPLDYGEVKPRTIFNFAPGPAEFINFKGDYVKLDEQEAAEGFRMSDPPDMKKTLSPALPNSSQRETTFTRKGSSLKSRFSGIIDSRLTADESGPLDREEERVLGLKGKLPGIRDSRLGPLDREEELRQMRELALSQTELKPLRGIERGSALPPIKTTRRGGKYKRRKRRSVTRRTR